MSLRFRAFAVLFLVCLLGLALQGLRVRAADEPLSLTEYWTLVKETRQEVAALVGQPEPAVHAGLLTLANRWEQIHQVRLEDGPAPASIVELDSQFWVSQLRAEKPDPKQLLASLDALLAAQAAPEKTPPAASLSALREILSRPEFQWQQSQAPSWFQELLDRFWKWLGRLLDQTGSLSVPGGLQGLGLIAALLLALVLAYSLRRLFASLASDLNLNPENGGTDAPLSAQAALTRAEGLSTQGDYRSAVRYLYLSALLILDERGLLYYDRTRTNREYLRDLTASPQIAALLRAVIEVFDRVWYGFQPVDAETYQRYVEQVHALKEQP